MAQLYDAGPRAALDLGDVADDDASDATTEEERLRGMPMSRGHKNTTAEVTPTETRHSYKVSPQVM